MLFLLVVPKGLTLVEVVCQRKEDAVPVKVIVVCIRSEAASGLR